MPFTRPVIISPEDAETVLNALMCAKSDAFRVANTSKVAATREYARTLAETYAAMAEKVTRNASQFGTPDLAVLFRKYGEHDESCAGYDDSHTPRLACSCGFTDAWYSAFPHERPR